MYWDLHTSGEHRLVLTVGLPSLEGRYDLVQNPSTDRDLPLETGKLTTLHGPSVYARGFALSPHAHARKQ